MNEISIEPELDLIEIAGMVIDLHDIAEVGEVYDLPAAERGTRRYHFTLLLRDHRTRPLSSPGYDDPAMARVSRQAVAEAVASAA